MNEEYYEGSFWLNLRHKFNGKQSEYRPEWRKKNLQTFCDHKRNDETYTQNQRINRVWTIWWIFGPNKRVISIHVFLPFVQVKMILNVDFIWFDVGLRVSKHWRSTKNKNKHANETETEIERNLNGF